MVKRTFQKIGVEVCPLGFGCMRLPVRADKKIDRPEAIRMIRSAIDRGVNYVDTAYYYHDGESEEVLAQALADGYRERVYLATKMPIYDLTQDVTFEMRLEHQLERLNTDHIDFYLLHCLNHDLWQNKVKKFDALESMKKARAEGKIQYLGFSFHDDCALFKEIIDAFDWDFCQIQFNYVDTDYQAGLEGLRYVAQKGISCVVMEPLRGGRLADSIPPLVKNELPQNKNHVELALDFVWDRPEVALLLSGMSTQQQVDDNLTYASRSAAGMLTEEERAAFARAAEVYHTMPLVACTGCRYCMPCPFGVSISDCFSLYNATVTRGKKKAGEAYAALTGRAELCRKCRQCVSACAQHIDIPAELEKVKECFTEQ